MLHKLVVRLWQDYAPKVTLLVTEIQNRNKDLHALGIQTGEACAELLDNIQLFKEKQVKIISEMFQIYEDVSGALKDLERGVPLQKDTGLTRSIGDPQRRELAKKYFEYMRSNSDHEQLPF